MHEIGDSANTQEQRRRLQGELHGELAAVLDRHVAQHGMPRAEVYATAAKILDTLQAQQEKSHDGGAVDTG